MEEIWKDIYGFPNYQVSNLGRIKNKKGKTLSQANVTNGYLIVNLCKNGKSSNKFVHRLVAMAFISNVENKPTVNHIDGNKHNNRVENLEWCTNKEQTAHALKIGLIDNKNRDWSKFAKAGQDANSKIVYQYDLNDDFINKYKSISEASRQTNTNHSNIIMCCKGQRKTAGGYKWRYKEENNGRKKRTSDLL